MARFAFKRAKIEEKGEVSGNWFGYSPRWSLRLTRSVYQLIPKYDGLETDGNKIIQSWRWGWKHLKIKNEIRVISASSLRYNHKGCEKF